MVTKIGLCATHNPSIRFLLQADAIIAYLNYPTTVINNFLKSKNEVALSGNISYLCSMGEKQKQRTIIFYKDYFQEFFVKQRDKVKDKIIWTFDLIEELQRIPETYLKHIENTDGLFEIRLQQGSDIFRIFCFFDQGQLVVLANGFQKKTQKTPKQEIEKALKIKEEYENEKK